MNKITEIQSKNLNIIKGIAVLMVVMIHCDFRGRLQQDFSTSLDLYMQCLTREIVYNAVPLFFFISGFLFYLKEESLLIKWKKRINSLLIPYVLWCSFYFVFLFVTQRFLGLENYFSGDKLKLVADFEIIDYLRMFWDIRDGGPILAPLWFLRNLILLCLLAPIFRFFTHKLKAFFLLLLLINYLVLHWHFIVLSDSNMFFFGLGIYLCNTEIKLCYLDRLKLKYIFTIWIVLIVGVMVAYCKEFSIYNILHRLFMIIDCIFVYSIVDKLSHKYDCKLLLKISAASFFIYLAHEPWISYIQSFFFKNFCLPEFVLIAMPWFFLLIALSYTYIGYNVLAKYSPSLYKLLTGTR